MNPFFIEAMGWAGYLSDAPDPDATRNGEAAVQLGLGAREIEDASGWAAWILRRWVVGLFGQVQGEESVFLGLDCYDMF